jgi:hypothetical protein
MPEKACYVYGILPGSVEVEEGARGLGGRDIGLVRHGEIAALVSEVDPARPLGTPEDLAVHQRLLDAVAAETPVLPLRFGAVLTDTGAVADDLLAANHDHFLTAVKELEGRVQFVLRGRYDERAVLNEVLAENGEAGRLRERVREGSERETYEARVRLGELVYQAIATKREVDTRRVTALLADHVVASREREPTHQQEAVHLTFLIELARRTAFETAIGDLGEEWRGRVELRLLGPMAAYDFVVAPAPGG